MADPHGKFDGALEDIFDEFVALQRGDETVDPGARETAEQGTVSLLLHFVGDLAPIEARGFRTQWVEDPFARGDVALADLHALSEMPEVIGLEHGGSGAQPLLDLSVVDVQARGSASLWTVDAKNGKFTGKIGKGTFVAIIDTGIDFRSPVFMQPGSTNTTRIKRIWDPGLLPHDGITGPDKTLLLSNFTYGVEYTEQMINDALQKKSGAKPVKHQDCSGHGTHVAATAAGDGRTSKGFVDKYDLVGVAPGADIIVVKLLYLQNEPKHAGVKIEELPLFQDAVNYVESVASLSALGSKPVAINASFGWSTGPHDGLGLRDLWLENHYKNATKRIFIAAAGNSGDSHDDRNHAKIKLPGTAPADATIDVPFTVFDNRTKKKDGNHCKPRSNTSDYFEIEFWYAPIAPKAVTTSLQPPTGAAKAAPALKGTKVTGKYKIGTREFTYHITHEEKATTRPPSTAAIKRNVIRMKFLKNGDDYGTGLFKLKLTAPAGTEFFGWAGSTWPPHGIKMGPGAKKLGTLPAGMTVPPEGTIGYPGTSKGAITVAAYDDFGLISTFSSRGPLVDYTGQGVYVDKPDIGAPGEEIKATVSRDSTIGRAGGLYAEWQGTSMAAPHVSGIVALLFEKKKNLSLAQVLKALRDKARPPNNKPNDFGAGQAHAKASHDAV